MRLLTVRHDAPQPPYEQMRAQIAEQIASGELEPGTRLPTVRRLAGDLRLAPNTVARAYRELEAAGLVRTDGRNGTVVAPQVPPDRQATSEVDAFIDGMAAQGITGDALIRLVRRRVGARTRAP